MPNPLLLRRVVVVLAIAMLGACTPSATVTPVPAGAGVAGGTAPMSAARAREERALVRTANAMVTVEEIAAARQRVVASVESMGGTIERDEVTEKHATFLLRVPDAHLEAALDAFATLGDLERRAITVQDVTAFSVDLDARIATLTASRDRLRELQDRTTEVGDLVSVERELTRVQAELEGLERQRDRLRQAVAMSAVSLTLNRKVVLGPLGVVAKGLGWAIEKLFVWR